MNELAKGWVCLACETERGGWANPCPACGKFGTVVTRKGYNATKQLRLPVVTFEGLVTHKGWLPRPLPLGEVPPSIKTVRSFPPFDALCTGGLARSFVCLLDGPKGSGKSTLATHIALGWPGKVLYLTSEQAHEFVSARAWRISREIKAELFVLHAHTLELDSEPWIGYDLCILDSLQGFSPNYREQLELARRVSHWTQGPAKTCALILSRVNAAGEAVGWQELPHLVDVCISLVAAPDSGDEVLATCTKNRNGPRVTLALSMGPEGFSQSARTLDM